MDLSLGFSVFEVSQLTSLAIGKAPIWLCPQTTKCRERLQHPMSCEEAGPLRQGKCWAWVRGMTGAPLLVCPCLPPPLSLTGAAQIPPRLPQVHAGGGAAAGRAHL